MKQQIDNLIANTLLDEGEVYLPQVGTLILYRHKAELLSSKALQRPYRELKFTYEKRGAKITRLIASIANISQERAEDIYTEWLERSLHKDILTINGLCIINNNNITTDKTFEDMANPQGRGKIKINPRTNYLIYILAGLCIGFALGIAGYVLYSNKVFDKLMYKSDATPATTKTEIIASPSKPATTPTEPTALSVAEEVAPVEEVAPAEKVAPAEEVIMQHAEPSILPMQKGTSYAVWGVYNELKNAEDAKAWLANKFPEIEANIYQYDARYMVALCELSTRTECGRRVSAWKTQSKSFNSVWVYTR